MLNFADAPAGMILLGVLIFAARIFDVSLGTMRIVFISRGQKFLAPLFGFFEMNIWLFAIRQIIMNITNPGYYIAFASGFAAGIFVGLIIEEKMAMGTRVIRIITKQDATELIGSLRKANYGVTSVDAQGNSGKVNLLFSVIKRSDIPNFVELINKFNPRAFYSIEDVRFVSEGIFPLRRSFFYRPNLTWLRMFGKMK